MNDECVGVLEVVVAEQQIFITLGVDPFLGILKLFGPVPHSEVSVPQTHHLFSDT